MTVPMSPWSTEAHATEDGVVIRLMFTVDPGPLREFRPFLDVDLDEAHASQLLGQLSIALRDRRDGKTSAA